MGNDGPWSWFGHHGQLEEIIVFGSVLVVVLVVFFYFERKYPSN